MKKYSYIFAVMLVLGMLVARPAHAELSNSDIQTLLTKLIAQVQELQRQLLVLQQQENDFAVGFGASPIRVVSPNGGEVLYRGDTQKIVWNDPVEISIPDYYDVYVRSVKSDTEKRFVVQSAIPTNTTGEQNSYAWEAGTQGKAGASIPNGYYVIEVCPWGADPETSKECDESDEYFKITDGSTNKKSLNVTYPTGGEKFEAGDKVAITWDSQSTIANEPLELRLKSPSCATTNYLLDAGIKNNGSYTWEISKDLVSEKCDYNIFLMVSNVKSPFWTSSESGAFQIVR